MNSKQFTIRVGDILSNCDIGLITDEQAINKIMRSYVKYINSRFKDSQTHGFTHKENNNG